MNQEKQELTEKQIIPSISGESKPNFLERFWFVFIGLAIVAILIIGIGSLWITNQRLLAPKPSPTPLPTPVVETETTISTLEKQGTSDEISAIEVDLEATDLSALDKELTEIEAELSSP